MPYLVLIDADEVIGIVAKDILATAARPTGGLRTLSRRDFVVLPDDTTLFGLITALQRDQAALAVIVPAGPEGRGSIDGCGVVTTSHIVEAIAEGTEIFED